MTMPDFDVFDFQEFCEEERQIDKNRPMPDSSTPPNPAPTDAIVGTIIAIAVIVLMIVFSDFLVPIVIVGGVVYLLVRWVIG